MTAPELKVERLGADILVLTLNRPAKRNALTSAAIEELTRAIHTADDDAATRGVLLAGAGPSFCAGVDLNEFAAGTPASGELLIRALATLCRSVRLLSKPVVAAIQGHCLGGALELVACGDLRVATPEAQLGMPEVWLGIPSVIDAVMLPLIVGSGRARELLLTGDAIDGRTAYEWGLVNQLAPESELVNAAAAQLRRIMRHAPEVIATQKRLHQQWLEVAYSRAVDASVDALLDAFRAGRPQRIAAERLRARKTRSVVEQTD